MQKEMLLKKYPHSIGSFFFLRCLLFFLSYLTDVISMTTEFSVRERKSLKKLRLTHVILVTIKCYPLAFLSTSPSIRKKKNKVTSQGHVVKKRPCYPSVGVCVVLCVSPIVSRSCESSGSSCWQGVTPTGRANVQPAQAFRDVRLFVQEATSVRVCCICGPILPRSRHLAFVTSCNPLHLSLWLLQLVRPPAATEAGLVILHGLCIRKSAHRVCVNISATVRVSLAIFGESALIHQTYCLGVTISTGSLLYE